MIERLIEWSVQNRFLVLVLAAVLAGGGLWAVRTTPVDAIPDLSDVQVIVKTTFPGQAPQVVEDQITYPLTDSLLGVPGVRTVRSYSFFGFSTIYVIFKDDVEFLLLDNTIQVRSASRAGKSDLGVNRKRIEQIRALYQQAGSQI